MHRAIPPLPNTPSWRGVQLKAREYLYLWRIFLIKTLNRKKTAFRCNVETENGYLTLPIFQLQNNSSLNKRRLVRKSVFCSSKSPLYSGSGCWKTKFLAVFRVRLVLFFCLYLISKRFNVYHQTLTLYISGREGE